MVATIGRYQHYVVHRPHFHHILRLCAVYLRKCGLTFAHEVIYQYELVYIHYTTWCCCWPCPSLSTGSSLRGLQYPFAMYHDCMDFLFNFLKVLDCVGLYCIFSDSTFISRSNSRSFWEKHIRNQSQNPSCAQCC